MSSLALDLSLRALLQMNITTLNTFFALNTIATEVLA
jgi:hypothetical protein